MHLNTLKPTEGSTKKRTRVGRGIGSGLGKTCGRGHKGQKSRSGGKVRAGFEGGQMPLQRRVPKFGFTSLTKATHAEVRLDALSKVVAETIDIFALREAGLISGKIKNVKVIASGKIEKAVNLVGIVATKGAKLAIEALGGKVE